MEAIKAQLEQADPLATWWPFIVCGIVFLITTIRVHMGGQVCPNTNSIRKQIVIVTGASGGIGKEVCKELCNRQAKVIMACKDMVVGEEAKKFILKANPKAEVEIKNLDLRSFDCVKRFVSTIQAEHDYIDILINNAGLMFHPYERTTDGFETHLQCNYLGHFLLTHLLMPLLEKSESCGRVINVSAHAYSTGKMSMDDPLNIGKWAPAFHCRDAFSHSKLAVVLGTKAMASIYKDTNVTINVCTPGLVRNTGHMSRSPVMKALCAKIITYPWMWILMKTPYQGAQTIVYLATEPKLSKTSGVYFNDCDVQELNDLAKNQELAMKLYEDTLKALKLK